MTLFYTLAFFFPPLFPPHSTHRGAIFFLSLLFSRLFHSDWRARSLSFLCWQASFEIFFHFSFLRTLSRYEFSHRVERAAKSSRTAKSSVTVPPLIHCTRHHVEMYIDKANQARWLGGFLLLLFFSYSLDVWIASKSVAIGNNSIAIGRRLSIVIVYQSGN